jgi:hypothetical protein
MPAGNSFEPLDTLKLALKGAVIIEGTAPDDFSGAKDASGFAARQKNFPIRAAANAPEQFVIGNNVPDHPS